ncbi:hypothetical protein CMT37_08970 [Elizabethkingia anophelis]|nr:hypothetical protein [Elizabethkingia anophelis]
MTVFRFLIILLFFSFSDFYSQENGKDFLLLRSKYENLQKNDSTAFIYLNPFIAKAKKEADFVRLTEAYKYAVYFSPSDYAKLSYADSTIYAALKSKDNVLISDSYLGKGIFYYFNLKKFEPALAQYLKAYEYSKDIKNDYLRQKIVYHLGVVKSYLGFYQEALDLFRESSTYFEMKINEENHPNQVFNLKKGYYNSLHQMVICYRNLKKYDIADSLVNKGLEELNNTDEFLLEKSYLLKCRGILAYNYNNHEGSIQDLNNARKEILKSKDFSWISVVYYYLGKNYMADNERMGLLYFEKVDSIFNKQKFIFPEVRRAYEDLIHYYEEREDIKKQLYYTNQLLKVDNQIGKDYVYLSSKIHREYDTKSLLESKKELEKISFIRMVSTLVCIVLAILFLIFAAVRYYREQKIKFQYLLLQDRLNQDKYQDFIINTQETEDSILKTILPEELYKELDQRLRIFEMQNEFIKKGLTLAILATKMHTNTYYLSAFINENKRKNFKSYINDLRITYITQLLNSEKKYLHYTIEALAEESGISTRQHFSKLFYEANGIRPKDFIRKRKQELGID